MQRTFNGVVLVGLVLGLGVAGGIGCQRSDVHRMREFAGTWQLNRQLSDVPQYNGGYQRSRTWDNGGYTRVRDRYGRNGGYDRNGRRTGNGDYDRNGNYVGIGGYDRNGRYTGTGGYDRNGNYVGSGGSDRSGGYDRDGRYTGTGEYDRNGNYVGSGNENNNGYYDRNGDYHAYSSGSGGGRLPDVIRIQPGTNDVRIEDENGNLIRDVDLTGGAYGGDRARWIGDQLEITRTLPSGGTVTERVSLQDRERRMVVLSTVNGPNGTRQYRRVYDRIG